MKSSVNNLRQRWQDEINSQGFTVEIFSEFDRATGKEAIYPSSSSRCPTSICFGLAKVIQISGFEVDFERSPAIPKCNGRPLAEFDPSVLRRGSLAVITNGVYYDLQTGESFEEPQHFSEPLRKSWRISHLLMNTLVRNIRLRSGPPTHDPGQVAAPDSGRSTVFWKFRVSSRLPRVSLSVRHHPSDIAMSVATWSVLSPLSQAP